MFKIVKKMSKKAKVLFLTACMSLLCVVPAFADVTPATSLLDSGTKTIISNFGAQLAPTVLELIGIIVPVGLALWAIALGIKKGLNYLKKHASKAI